MVREGLTKQELVVGKLLLWRLGELCHEPGSRERSYRAGPSHAEEGARTNGSRKEPSCKHSSRGRRGNGLGGVSERRKEETGEARINMCEEACVGFTKGHLFVGSGSKWSSDSSVDGDLGNPHYSNDAHDSSPTPQIIIIGNNILL